VALPNRIDNWSSTARIVTGTVSDPSNAVVAGAKVTLVSTTTRLTRSVATASAGEYAITNLKPDTYSLIIEHPDFQKCTRQVQVLVGSRNDVSAQLNVTSVSTTLEVAASGETATVNTETQTRNRLLTFPR